MSSLPKVWLVTGSSSGLGREVVEHVLSRGDIAVATLRKPSAISDLASQYDSTKLLILKLDVTNPAEIKAAFSKVKETYGRLDVVYSNAGFGAVGETEGTPDDVARGLFEVNFWGSTNVALEAVRFFREENPVPGGKLLQASSMAAAAAWPGTGYYSASKNALESVNEALAKELKPEWNIKITILELGGFATKIQESTVLTPAHPAYADGPAAAIRAYMQGPQIGGDAKKAAREIYNIALNLDNMFKADNDGVPLRIPLGKDAIGIVGGQLEAIRKDVERAGIWSENLE
ncbi:hypothetical protein VKT23_010496 [Stygiomarasmius scandens]|uniref:NAD(P)-binding protein n=1 Tax=Marasmiellus scandens TaxID=2682957 RepID=A0ABR1JEJ2_9AGAR